MKSPLLMDRADGSPIVSWEWDFGSNNLIFSGTNETQTQSYTLSGEYAANMTVTDVIGCVDEYELLINVNDPDIWSS